MFYIEKAQTLPLQGIKREDDHQMSYVLIDFIIIIFFHASFGAAFKMGAKDFSYEFLEENGQFSNTCHL